MGLGIPASAIGLIVSGDVGALTIYTDRFGRKVWYPKSPPKKAPSPLQSVQRQRFACAIQTWNATFPAERRQYERLSQKASLACTGLNLWIHLAFNQDALELDTLNRLAGENAILPPGVTECQEQSSGTSGAS